MTRYTYQAGDCCLARRNHLVKFMATSTEFEPLLFCFDEAFLRQHSRPVSPFLSSQAIIKLRPDKLIDSFIRSVEPYYLGAMQLETAFEDVKYEELLIILLRTQPDIAGILFNFDPPQKINLAEFMNRNFRFNVSLERFAYLTGRSLSAFKRDFKAIFSETPSRWLTRKRLQEARFLLSEQHKTSDIYLELGFGSLSHFSTAFKKEFGFPPSSLLHTDL